MDYILNDRLFSTTDTNTQALLATAYKGKKRPLCACTHPRPEMYIARAHKKFLVKRMPETGSEHAPDCPSYMPPEELSGLAQVHGSAIDESPEDGTTLLKLDFALSMRGKAKVPPPAGDTAPTEANSPSPACCIISGMRPIWSNGCLGWQKNAGGVLFTTP